MKERERFRALINKEYRRLNYFSSKQQKLHPRVAQKLVYVKNIYHELFLRL